MQAHACPSNYNGPLPEEVFLVSHIQKKKKKKINANFLLFTHYIYHIYHKTMSVCWQHLYLSDLVLPLTILTVRYWFLEIWENHYLLELNKYIHSYNLMCWSKRNVIKSNTQILWYDTRWVKPCGTVSPTSILNVRIISRVKNWYWQYKMCTLCILWHILNIFYKEYGAGKLLW